MFDSRSGIGRCVKARCCHERQVHRQPHRRPDERVSPSSVLFAHSRVKPRAHVRASARSGSAVERSHKPKIRVGPAARSAARLGLHIRHPAIDEVHVTVVPPDRNAAAHRDVPFAALRGRLGGRDEGRGRPSRSELGIGCELGSSARKPPCTPRTGRSRGNAGRCAADPPAGRLAARVASQFWQLRQPQRGRCLHALFRPKGQLAATGPGAVHHRVGQTDVVNSLVSRAPKLPRTVLGNPPWRPREQLAAIPTVPARPGREASRHTAVLELRNQAASSRRRR